jgi:hypothetical protein
LDVQQTVEATMRQASLTILIAIILCGAANLAFAAGGSMAMSAKDLPDDVRASIAKEMAKAKQFKDEQRKDSNGNAIEDEGGNGSRTSSSCQMEVGSTPRQPVGTRAPSRTVTVVQGNVIQMCGK